jgi:riboflavin synthase alpha subunit
VQVFTGIVQALGEVARVREQAEDRDFVVRAPSSVLDRLEIGGSIALNGVCQTVTALAEDTLTVHAIAETLRVTTLGEIRAGDHLNLETALGAGDPLGGHFVQGHVDGTATLRTRRRHGESTVLRFDADRSLLDQLVAKGSITLDGVSLTVGPEPGPGGFEVHLIPHTLQVTTLGKLRIGDRVNVETDILGKYVLRFLGESQQVRDLDWEGLRRAGFGADSSKGGS